MPEDQAVFGNSLLVACAPQPTEELLTFITTHQLAPKTQITALCATAIIIKLCTF